MGYGRLRIGIHLICTAMAYRLGGKDVCLPYIRFQQDTGKDRELYLLFNAIDRSFLFRRI